MEKNLQKVALRQSALLIPAAWSVASAAPSMDETTASLLANCSRLGYTFSQELLEAVKGLSPKHKLALYEALCELSGVKKNWTPLVKQWDEPTGESVVDHIVTFFANLFQLEKGTKLPCGHLIPDNTFPLERYNGCPYCGTPFDLAPLDYEAGRNKLKVLNLWTEEQAKIYLEKLLLSPVALDATQADSLKLLLGAFSLPEGMEIRMKETRMLVVEALVEQGKEALAGKLFSSPNDVLRYLWYKHTGFLQLVEPKTIIRRMSRNSFHIYSPLDERAQAGLKTIAELKLKYGRAESRMYARWLNELEMDAAAQCAVMHPKRGMWVRVIRALRLAEYSKQKGFEPLAEMLDRFYNGNYEVWQGRVDQSRQKMDAEAVFALLKQRPGLFARALFSSMLWFGPELTIGHFREIMDKAPARLVFTLYMYAETYFDKSASRTVKPLGGVSKRIAGNKLLQLYSDEDLLKMQSLVRELALDVMKGRMEAVQNPHTTIYIDEALYKIPLAIGDRSEQVQDLPSALMGTRFPVEGNTVRLFMQWGEGLPAQHMDMDLSCRVNYGTRTDSCSYSNLVTTGCKHSGDIRSIPNKAGTAEYIDLDLVELEAAGAKNVSFTCNAYSNGSLTPNMVVGWMNSAFPMKISGSGVAYDPTAVQHEVRITHSLTKGLVFGVLDIAKREIVWLEMAFDGQLVRNFDSAALDALLQKLEAKLKIGDLLQLRAEIQGLTPVKYAELADEVYDLNWALDTARVSTFFLD